MVGREYVLRIPAFASALAADRMLCQVAAPATAVLFLKRAWFGQISNSNLNEVNAVRLVRCSTAGTGGASMVAKETTEGDPAFGGSGTAHDSDGWTAEPTITDTLHELPFNLAAGFEWAPTDDDGYIVVPPSGRVGLQLARAPSASMTWAGGLVVQEIG